MVGGALALLVLMNDFGTSLLFFGVFLAMLYLATSRLIYVVGGLAVFALGAYLSYRLVPHVADRVDIWLHPWQDVYGSGYQSVQALYAIADGGAFGTGLGRGYLLTTGGQPVVPAIQTDFIYAAIANETGLAGVAALLLVYLLVVAARAQDGEPRRRRLLEAAGGRAHDRPRPAGVPDRGRHRARRAADRHHAPVRVVRRLVAGRELGRAGAAVRRLRSRAAGGAGVNRAIGRVYAVLASGLVLLLGFTAYWQLWAEPSLAARRDNAHQVVQQLSIRRGLIIAADGTKLAINHAATTADGRHVYERRYPTKKMFAHVVGYSSATDGRAGVERSANDYLIGRAHRPRRRARRISCTRWRAARSRATTCSSRSCRPRSERR